MERHSFTASDGANLSYLLYRKGGGTGAPGGVLAIIHGIAYHAEPYMHTLADAAPDGWLVAALDLRGHGYSDGARGVRMPPDRVNRDIGEWLAHITNGFPGVKVSLLGQSMGTVYALRFARTHPGRLSGLILMAPAAILACQQVLHPQTAWHLFRSLLSPRRPVINVAGWRLVLATRDPDFLKMRSADTTAFDNISFAYLVQLGYAALSNIIKRPRLSCPVLILHGTADKVLSLRGARLLARRISAPDVTLKVIEDAAHMLPWDPATLEIRRITKGWLSANS